MLTAKCRITRHIKVITVTGLSVLFAHPLLAAPDDAHHGTYEAGVADAQNVYFYEQGDQQYLYSMWGVVPIVVNDKAEFKAVNPGLGLSGHFYHLDSGEYQSGKLNYNSFSMTFGRIKDLPDQERIAALFDDAFWDSISSSQNCPHNEWKQATKVAFDRSLIKGLIEASQQQGSKYSDTNSLLIAKDGKLVVEEYFNGWQLEFPHMIQSITKSLTSLALGAAIQDELISGSEAKMAALMPNYSALLKGDKAQLSMHHFLTMSAGLDWDEWNIPYEDPNNVRQQEIASINPIDFILDRELISKPGEQFRYNGGLVTVVGQVVADKSDHDNLSGVIREEGLNKLCLQSAYLMKQNGEVSNAAGGAYLRPRDMLKLGQLVAQKGQWHGEQIVSEQWIDQSVKGYVSTGVGPHSYGYYWWTSDAFVDGTVYPITYGLGYGGQVVAIVDELNLVVARTANHFSGPTPNHEMMKEYIIPAFLSAN
ncbi:serine hydrolase domain-containing protein [Vibrio ouci]|uniref:Class C beta-lactamase-related serine hydrolase n=1 Tax=Vibrio ouci TaxID=2499078 RepID=A0A4Y8WA88_9VIBR|nr:serine hydrolase [Vibrio ouci]TFH89523.1 class C beta-lactamase-related serine hydrolase [Vibrio ouci]